jgi:glycosyltransferase involved in cell wall biosynthesis
MLAKKIVKQVIIRLLNRHPKLRKFCGITQTNQIPQAIATQLAQREAQIRDAQKIGHNNQKLSQPSLNVYYYVDHTCQYIHNTGVQQVARSSLVALTARELNIIPIKWSTTHKCFQQLSIQEMACLLLFCQQDQETLHQLYSTATETLINASEPHPTNQLLLIPEVPHINNHHQNLTQPILDTASQMGLKTAFLFYDATPLERPELAHMKKAHRAYMNAIPQANFIFPISDFSKERLNHFTAINAKKNPELCIKTIHLASSLHETIDSTPSKTICENPYLLSVGSLSKHKNQLTLMQAFITFKAKHPKHSLQLVLCGSVCPVLQPIVQQLTEEHTDIIILEGASNSTLVQAYQHCLFTIFPSLMEGFGLPIIESLYFNKPCITANFGAMAEIAGENGCLLVDTREISQLTNAIELLATNKQLLHQKTCEAEQRRIDNWHDYADKVMTTVTGSLQPKTAELSTATSV